MAQEPDKITADPASEDRRLRRHRRTRSAALRSDHKSNTPAQK
jgi:hypothetical protein